jgi:hypothetical protein
VEERHHAAGEVAMANGRSAGRGGAVGMRLAENCGQEARERATQVGSAGVWPVKKEKISENR